MEEKKVLQGKAVKDVTYASEKEFSSEEVAREAFPRSVQKLLDVDRWSDLPGISSTFELYDRQGQRKPHARPQVGDRIKILLPGPFPENWVEVTDLKVAPDNVQFTVSPCPRPDATGKDRNKVEHFFTDEATSTYKVERLLNSIHAYEIGRNEGINNQGEKAGNRKVVNTLIAEGGWLAFQKLQWKKLTDHLVHHIEIDRTSEE